METLLAYNVEDVLTLERLAVLAYNRKLTGTPFAAWRGLPEAESAANPFQADGELIRHVRRRLGISVGPRLGSESSWS